MRAHHDLRCARNIDHFFSCINQTILPKITEAAASFLKNQIIFATADVPIFKLRRATSSVLEVIMIGPNALAALELSRLFISPVLRVS